jgi:hypothetical protein
LENSVRRKNGKQTNDNADKRRKKKAVVKFQQGQHHGVIVIQM